MTPVKKGDRVRVLEEEFYTHRLGQVGTAARDSDSLRDVRVLFDNTTGHSTIDLVELVEDEPADEPTTPAEARTAALHTAREMLGGDAHPAELIAFARFITDGVVPTVPNYSPPVWEPVTVNEPAATRPEVDTSADLTLTDKDDDAVSIRTSLSPAEGDQYLTVLDAYDKGRGVTVHVGLTRTHAEQLAAYLEAL